MISNIFSHRTIGVFLWVCIIIASCSPVKSQNSEYQNITIECGKSLTFPQNHTGDTGLGNGEKWYHLSRTSVLKELTSAVNQLSTFEFENVLNTSLLEIISVTIYDTGWYSCLRQSGTTNQVLHSIWLDVHCDGDEKNQLQRKKTQEIQNGKGNPFTARKLYLFENNATTLRLWTVFRGYPQPFKINWQENGNVISSGLSQIVLNASLLKIPSQYINEVCNKNGCMNEKYTVKSTAHGKVELQEAVGKFIALFCYFNSESRWNSEWNFYDNVGNRTKLKQQVHDPTETYTTYKITKVNDENEGEYECKANAVDFKWENKHVFHLKVVERISGPNLNISSISTSPTNKVSARCDEKAVFYCYTGVEGIEARWYRLPNMSSLEMNSNRTINTFVVQPFDEQQSYSPEFLFDLVSIYDTGLYICLNQSDNYVFNATWLDVSCSDSDKNQQVKNEIEKIQNGKGAPYISRKIFSMTNDGTTPRLSCLSRGYPTPTINWIKYHHEKIQNETLEKSTLLLPGTQKGPQNYTCSICNENGCINETFLIEIKENGIISLDLNVDQSAKIGCELNFTSSFILEWNFYGERENKTLATRYSAPEKTFYDYYYSIDAATRTHEGVYECKAYNSEKEIKRRFYLHITNTTNLLENNSLGNYDTIIFITTSSLILLLIGVVFYAIMAYCKLKRKRNIEKTEMQQFVKKIIVEKQIDINRDIPDCLNMPIVSIQRIQSDILKSGMVSNDEYEMSIDPQWELPRNNLRLGNTLGEGEFGKVVRGEALNISGQENVTTTVAVKMLKDKHTDNDMIDLVSEMELMKLIGQHPNILRMIGCCTQKGPLLVITEYAANGNLKNYLRKLRIKNENVPENTLINYTLQIAQGMEYLASIKCIHRDLAARNILVMADYTMKIADFGLARNIRNKDYYKKTSAGRLPIKWMAPEAICRHHYTIQSDVWSFGVLLWEIVTLGGNPYPTFNNMVELFHAILKNYRMEKPPYTSSNIYNLMMSCWKYEPEHRPNFSTIVEILTELSTNIEPKITDQSEHDELISATTSASETTKNENDDEQITYNSMKRNSSLLWIS